MKKIGAFVGKFYPPHIGHLHVIDEVSKKLDELYIIISKNNIRNNNIKTNQGFDVLPAELIKSWFSLHYKNNKKIKVEIFDESEFQPYPKDCDKWALKFKKTFPMINVKVADEGYREYNNKYFKEYEFFSIDRDEINIHSTQIRNNIADNLEFIIKEARDYFKNLI